MDNNKKRDKRKKLKSVRIKDKVYKVSCETYNKIKSIKKLTKNKIKNLIKSKKGSIIFELSEGIINLIFWIISVVLVLAVLKYIVSSFSVSSVVPTEGKTAILNGYTALALVFNFIPLLLYLGLIYVSIKKIKKDPESKVFTVLWAFFLIGYIGALFILPSNVYEGLKSSSSIIASITTDIPIFNYMFTNSLYFGAIYFIITGIAFITKGEIKNE